VIVDRPGRASVSTAVGELEIAEKSKNGQENIRKSQNVHLGGGNLMPALKGETEWPREEFLYWTDDGNLAALRYDQWKVHFLVQRAHGFDVWSEPFVGLRLPLLVSLRSDPFERTHHDSILYDKWRLERAFVLVTAQAYVSRWLESFKDYPPRQKPGSFSLDQVMDQLTEAASN
jgi:arylsulfatase